MAGWGIKSEEARQFAVLIVHPIEGVWEDVFNVMVVVTVAFIEGGRREGGRRWSPHLREAQIKKKNELR